MSAPASDLRHTPLHGRHAAAGARLVPFAGWEMPVQYAGHPPGAPRGAHPRRRVRRLAHGGDRDLRPAGRRLPPARAHQRRPPDPRGRRPVRARLPRGRRHRRRPLHLPPGRAALPDGHQRGQPRQGPGVVPAPGGRLRRRRGRPRGATSPCSPSRARTPGRSSSASPTAACRRASTSASAASPASRCSWPARATRARTASSCWSTPTAPATVWDALMEAGVEPVGPRRARHAAPGGQLPPLRQRHGRDPQPDRGGARLGLQGGHGLRRRRRRPRRPGGRDGREARRLRA